LKRVEKTAPRQDDPQDWPRKIDEKKAVNSRAKKTWFYNRLFSILLILIILLAAGWLLFDYRNLIIARLFPETADRTARQTSPASGKKAAVYHAKVDRPSAIPKKNPLSKSQLAKPLPRQTVSEKGPVATNASQPAAGLTSSSNQKQPQRLPQTLETKKKVTPTVNAVRPQKYRQSTDASASKPGIENTGKKSAQNMKKPAARDNDSSIQRMLDSTLKLQAIAWSEDPSRRMAVINNHIVREGESIDGFSVTRIRQEDVLVNDGTQPWRLEFGLRN
jgi:hypothetical protein